MAGDVPAGADAEEHLHEVGSRDRQEPDACFTDDRTGEHGDHGGGAAASQDGRRAQVGGVAERALTLDDDHFGRLGVERFDHGGLEFAGDELGRDCVERRPVPGALDQARLTRPDQDRP